MNIEERAAQAAAWKATGQCNCAQAVLKAFEDKLSVDADTLMKLGAGYAAGMGCMESTCGALIGAVMVAGVVTDGKGTPRISKELLVLTDHSVSEIAQEVGFGDASNFSTRFAKATGQSPLQYRKRALKPQEGTR